MSKSVLDLIIHPVRLQIIQLISLRQMTTQEIGAALPDVATSSLYRHLKQLLDSGIIAVVETNQVRGIEEKVYGLAEAPVLGDPSIFAEMGPDENLRYFMMYVASLIQGFSNYAYHSPNLDPLADGVGYSEIMLWATAEEVAALGNTLNEVLLPLVQQGPGDGRRLRKVGLVLHPVFLPEEGEDRT